MNGLKHFWVKADHVGRIVGILECKICGARFRDYGEWVEWAIGHVIHNHGERQENE